MSETSKFTEDILTAAREKARGILEDAQNKRQRLLEEANAAIVREVNEILRNAQTEAEGIKRRQVSEARHKMKLLEQSEKDKILTSVLDEVQARLRATTGDESTYLRYLGKLAAEAIRQLGLEEVTVHLNPDDTRRIDITKLRREIETHKSSAKVEIAEKPISTSGGLVVSSQDGKIRIVNTFEQRFEALEPKLLIEAGRLLFSET